VIGLTALLYFKGFFSKEREKKQKQKALFLTKKDKRCK
jgi:hypothetical protein